MTYQPARYICDGPGCQVSIVAPDPLRLQRQRWITVERSGATTRHFHTQQCLDGFIKERTRP